MTLGPLYLKADLSRIFRASFITYPSIIMYIITATEEDRRIAGSVRFCYEDLIPVEGQPDCYWIPFQTQPKLCTPEAEKFILYFLETKVR
jgi:hypothetical protein